MSNSGPRVQSFDPPMCCPTGLCGPTIDPVLLDINEAITTLKLEGVTVERYLLNAQPQAFLANPEVLQMVRERQLAVLPITVVDGRIVKTGAYPTLEELRDALSAPDRTR
ncbi:MAG TPA: arsenite efflux transporter metallochaperone ArsD [Firmicutes bacterium]|nr:arsenite efflux transporter metallochaperone ArsD [Candidatus Fermentithermobacillaceae bacterium]